MRRRTVVRDFFYSAYWSSRWSVPALSVQFAPDPLPSGNDRTAKQAILHFVANVTTQGRAGFVPRDQRIAAFDNDGTLCVEQPIAAELAFSFDRVRAWVYRR
jgi:hypothetical protein